MTMVKENIVSFDTAKKLKENGFPQCAIGMVYTLGNFPVYWEKWNNDDSWWEEQTPIEGSGVLLNMSSSLVHYELNTDMAISAPTFTLVTRWLREEKGIDILPYRKNNHGFYGTKKYTLFMVFDKLNNTENVGYNGNDYDSFDEAIEAGIQKALELI